MGIYPLSLLGSLLSMPLGFCQLHLIRTHLYDRCPAELLGSLCNGLGLRRGRKAAMMPSRQWLLSITCCDFSKEGLTVLRPRMSRHWLLRGESGLRSLPGEVLNLRAGLLLVSFACPDPLSTFLASKKVAWV